MSMASVPAGESMPAASRAWPKALGILAIVWGGIAVLWKVANLTVGLLVTDSGPPPIGGTPAIVISVISGILSLVLLAAGVQLLRHRCSGVHLLRAWVIVSLLAGAAEIGILVQDREPAEALLRQAIDKQTEDEAKRSGKPLEKVPEQLISGIWLFSLGCGGLLTVVPPLVAAFFVFGRRGREAIADWSQPPVDPWTPPAV